MYNSTVPLQVSRKVVIGGIGYKAGDTIRVAPDLAAIMLNSNDPTVTRSATLEDAADSLRIDRALDDLQDYLRRGSMRTASSMRRGR